MLAYTQYFHTFILEYFYNLMSDLVFFWNFSHFSPLGDILHCNTLYILGAGMRDRHKLYGVRFEVAGTKSTFII